MCEWRTIARSPAVSAPLPCSAAPARRASGPADGKEVERAVEVPVVEAEVGGGDRRREAVVEGLGQSESLVDGVPAQLQRPTVYAQLARVVEAEQLDPAEVRLAELAELLRAVLLDVPGVVGLLRSLRRQRQQVRGGDVGDAALPQHRHEGLEH